MSMMWVGIGSAVIGAGSSIYGANKAASAAKAGQRNLPNEIGGILGQVPAAGAAGLANRTQNDPAYTALGNANLRGGLFGTPSMSAYAQTPGVQQHIAENRASGYYDNSWTDEAIAQNYYDNVGRQAGDQIPTTGGLADSLTDLQGSQDRANAGSSTFQRGSNLADMQALAPGAEALRRSLNPEYFASLGAVDRVAGAPIGASPYEQQFGAMALGGFDPGSINARVGGPSGLTRQMTAGAMDGTRGPAALESSLFGQAQDALAQGGDLTAQEQRNSVAGSRAAYADRGLGDSNSALAAEVLNLDSAKRARLDSNRNFASGVTSLLRSGQAADRGYGLNLDSANLARTQLRGSLQGQNVANRMLQRQNDLAGLSTADAMARSRGTEGFNRLTTAAGLRSQSLFDPTSVLGTVDNRLNSTASLGMAQQQFQGSPDYTSQLLGYGNDVYGTNANANAAGQIGQANAYGSLGGGLLSAAGSLGSAYIKRGGTAAGGS